MNIDFPFSKAQLKQNAKEGIYGISSVCLFLILYAHINSLFDSMRQ